MAIRYTDAPADPIKTKPAPKKRGPYLAGKTEAALKPWAGIMSRRTWFRRKALDRAESAQKTAVRP